MMHASILFCNMYSGKKNWRSGELTRASRPTSILPMAVIASAYLIDGVDVCKELVAGDPSPIVALLCMPEVMWGKGCPIAHNRSLQQVCSMLYEEGKANRVDKRTLVKNPLFRDFCYGDHNDSCAFPRQNPTLDCTKRAPPKVCSPSGSVAEAWEVFDYRKDSHAHVKQSTQDSLEHPRCFQCGKRATTGTKFKVCSGCEIAAYCSVACQKKHWKRHKEACKSP